MMSKQISSSVSELVVSYKNKANKLQTSVWEVNVNNLFFGLIGYMKETDEREFTLDFDYIEKLAGTTFEDRRKFLRFLRLFISQSGEMIGYVKKVNHVDTIVYENFFNQIVINPKENTVFFKVSENELSDAFLGQLNGDFMRFQFSEYVYIENKYAKILYRLIMQYKNMGEARLDINELKLTMNREKIENRTFVSTCLAPAINEIKEKIPSLNSITYEFTKKGNAYDKLIVFFPIFKKSHEHENKEKFYDDQITYCVNEISKIIKQPSSSTSILLYKVDSKSGVRDWKEKYSLSFDDYEALKSSHDEYVKYKKKLDEIVIKNEAEKIKKN